jgi:hypothetical protein
MPARTERRDETEKAARAARTAVEKYLQQPHPAPRDASRIISPHPRHNVVGVGIGQKKVKNKNTSTLCVRLFVRHKFRDGQLSKKLALPKTIGAVPTDIIPVGSPRRSAPGAVVEAQRLRPARPGCWISAAALTDISLDFPGTFGAVVEDGNGALYILSNNHVLANEDQNSLGTIVYQPGSGKAANKIASLALVVPLQRPGGNKIDCALARVSGKNTVHGVPLDIGPLSSELPIDPAPGMKVEKAGAATGHTTGTVGSVGATFRIDEYMTGPVLLEDQIQIEDGAEPFCDHGDSGSLVIDVTTKRATGLLTINMDGFALANRLSNVLAALSAKLGLPLRLKIS